MRRSQGRRSSNTLPIRPGVLAKPVSNLSTSMASAHKRTSSIPRPSVSSVVKPMYGQRQDQSLAVGVTPSKNGSSRFTGLTPQMGGTTPQSRGNMTMTGTSKPYLKETRNLNDKNCVLEMSKNVAQFLNDVGYAEIVTHKEVQKIDKQSFMKYFNYIYQFIDPNYYLATRFNEDELIRNMKDVGYCGTLAKSALVSIGALHSTSQIAGLLCWLCDIIKAIAAEHEDVESSEKAELIIISNSYSAWCLDEDVNLIDLLRCFFMEKHQIQEGRVEMLEHQIQAIAEEYKALEKKSSLIQELKAEANKEEQRLEEISAKQVQIQQRRKELQNEDKHLLQRLEEIREKTSLGQKEIAELQIAAKNCKVSADEARRIKSGIAANKRDCAAVSEQHEQVAKLVEKREMQFANIAAQDIKWDRELNVELMDMGMTIPPDMDPKEALKNFLDTKISRLSNIESRCIALNENKERILAEISQLKMELKHTELLKSRLEEKLQSVKADRDEMERLYLSQLAEMEGLSVAPRSDPLQMRQQYDLETFQQKFAEQKAQMNKQEKDLQVAMAKYAEELKTGENEIVKLEAIAVDYFARLGDGFRQLLEKAEICPISPELINALIPKPNFN